MRLTIAAVDLDEHANWFTPKDSRIVPSGFARSLSFPRSYRINSTLAERLRHPSPKWSFHDDYKFVENFSENNLKLILYFSPFLSPFVNIKDIWYKNIM